LRAGLRIGKAAVALCAAVALAAAAEVVFRLASQPSGGFARYLLRTEMNLARWSFLASREDRLVTERVAGSLRPGEQLVRGPEPGRPPFDRVDAAYSIRINDEGFRERPFRWGEDRGRPLVLVVGDSVTFGKGIEEEDRFTRKLEALLPGGAVVYALAIPGCATDCLALIVEAHVARKPDLILLQASGNDLDLSLWRQARGSSLAGPGLWSLRVLSSSRLLMAAAYALSGDPTAAQVVQAEDAAAAWYGADAARAIDAARSAGVPVAVFQVANAQGTLFRHPLVDACRSRPDACLGVADIAIERCGDGADAPSWIRETARLSGLPVEEVAAAFPLAACFFDVVHPNVEGNAAIARRLAGVVGAWLARGGAHAR
jgi:lysophospholipase L1-like esterase